MVKKLSAQKQREKERRQVVRSESATIAKRLRRIAQLIEQERVIVTSFSYEKLTRELRFELAWRKKE